MNDAYEIYDYGDLFPRRESSSSIRMREESKNNTNEKYLKELKRKADEATRKSFTDKLSERMKDLNEELNTKALEEMVFFYENKPIKLKELMFNNMKKTAEAMNDSLGVNKTDSNDEKIAVQNLNSEEMSSNIAAAFDSSSMNSGLPIEETSNTDVSESLPPVVSNGDGNTSEGSNFFDEARSLDNVETTAQNSDSLSPVISDGDANTSEGSNFFDEAGSFDNVETTAQNSEPLPPVISDGDANTSEGSNFFDEAGSLDNVETTAQNSESLSASPEVEKSIDDYMNSHLGLGEDTASRDDANGSDFSQIEAPDLNGEPKDSTSENFHIPDDDLKDEIADFIGARPTGDDKYTFPVTTIPDKTSEKDVIRGEDVQIVPERASLSDEIGYADNNEDSQVNKGLAEEVSEDVSQSLTTVPSNDTIFDATQSEESPAYESSDKSTIDTKNVDEGDKVVDSDLGELFGYNNSDGGLNFSSLVPDLIRQHDETARIGLELDDRIGEQARKKSELEQQEAMQAQTTRELASRLYNLTAFEASKNAEKQEAIEDNNKELELMMKTIRDNASTIATLRQMLGESTDVNEDEDVKGRSM